MAIQMAPGGRTSINTRRKLIEIIQCKKRRPIVNGVSKKCEITNAQFCLHDCLAATFYIRSLRHLATWFRGLGL